MNESFTSRVSLRDLQGSRAPDRDGRAGRAVVMTIEVPDFATPVDPERAWMLRWGPSCIPVRDMFGGYSHPGGRPDYGRYIPIDLDANNRASVDAYCARNPDRPRPVLGWGVCRHGFGLQHHDGVLSEAEAESWAIGLNRAINIGEN